MSSSHYAGHSGYTGSTSYYDPLDGPRRNSDGRHRDLQYYTPRGSVAARAAERVVTLGPPTDVNTRSRYPHNYHNTEGPPHARYSVFADWERRDATTLHEYPVNVGSRQHFDFGRRTSTLAQISRPVHHNDRDRVARNPLNDAGYFRAVTDTDRRRVVGAMYHPQGVSDFRAARLEPLDRTRRRELNNQSDRILFRRESYPPR